MRTATLILAVCLLVAGCTSHADEQREALEALYTAQTDEDKAQAFDEVERLASESKYCARWAGFCYDFGYGVDPDLSKARAMWTRAVALGDTTAQKFLDDDRIIEHEVYDPFTGKRGEWEQGPYTMHELYDGSDEDPHEAMREVLRGFLDNSDVAFK